MNETELYPLKKADLKKARQSYVEAFANDPFCEYVLAGEKENKAVVETIHTFGLTLGLQHGKAYAPTHEIEGVAMWFPPGRTSPTIWAGLRAGLLNLLKAPAVLTRMMIYSRYAEELHKKHAHFPHWYLFSIGIGEGYRGKGYASKLLKPLMKKFDQEKVACYLETHNPSNVGLYQHFDFAVVEEGKIPGTNTTHWAMLRK